MSSIQNRPPVPGWDVAISVASLVFTFMLGGLAVLAGIFSLAFLDYCPTGTCSAGGAVTAVAATLVTAGVVGVVGLILTIVRIARKRISWPFAVGTLLLCLLTCTVGAAFYVAAVGG
ncbi:hypothetical protein QMK17_08565 [Rhodococcus sp. G-MC3]|uniref:hypothetical protein n=1 Tax=Rhodococcus sp. G-MC3 TaxID=3046209 RepID=UPI0024BAE16D|nr:hypothetical protein [Rhodococcus sp. G-MC3]MDJ0393384.1 hypothetical protein [Rhodococcus sp. G-MC3]